MHAWFHAPKHNGPELLTAALKPGGLLAIEGYTGDKGDFQTNQLPRGFGNLKRIGRSPSVLQSDLITMVGAVAACIPARRAARVDPIQALRNE